MFFLLAVFCIALTSVPPVEDTALYCEINMIFLGLCDFLLCVSVGIYSLTVKLNKGYFMHNLRGPFPFGQPFI